ncbi:MAG: hypothetical protein HYW01_02740 [Deltaproteobacteria bacterium]|nr:hypothetical protein [Deltaproteobacteria bacterium]
MRYYHSINVESLNTGLFIIGLLKKKTDPKGNELKNGEKNTGRNTNGSNRGEGISGINGEVTKKELGRVLKVKNGERTSARNTNGLNANKKVDCGKMKNGETKKWWW